MSILIKGMEMPKSFKDIRIYADGRIVSKSLYMYGEEIATAVPVPPHGRLIDADALRKDGCGNCYGCPYDGCIIAAAPTIIPEDRKVRKGEQKR